MIVIGNFNNTKLNMSFFTYFITHQYALHAELDIFCPSTF